MESPIPSRANKLRLAKKDLAILLTLWHYLHRRRTLAEQNDGLTRAGLANYLVKDQRRASKDGDADVPEEVSFDSELDAAVRKDLLSVAHGSYQVELLSFATTATLNKHLLKLKRFGGLIVTESAPAKRVKEGQSKIGRRKTTGCLHPCAGPPDHMADNRAHRAGTVELAGPSRRGDQLP